MFSLRHYVPTLRILFGLFDSVFVLLVVINVTNRMFVFRERQVGRVRGEEEGLEEAEEEVEVEEEVAVEEQAGKDQEELILQEHLAGSAH